MKVESVIFECPILFRGYPNKDHSQKIIATNIDDFILCNNLQSRKRPMFLITAKFNDDYFVISKISKLNKATRSADRLSRILDVVTTVIKVHNNEKIIVYTTEHPEDTSNELNDQT